MISINRVLLFATIYSQHLVYDSFIHSLIQSFGRWLLRRLNSIRCDWIGWHWWAPPTDAYLMAVAGIVSAASASSKRTSQTIPNVIFDEYLNCKQNFSWNIQQFRGILIDWRIFIELNLNACLFQLEKASHFACHRRRDTGRWWWFWLVARGFFDVGTKRTTNQTPWSAPDLPNVYGRCWLMGTLN